MTRKHFIEIARRIRGQRGPNQGYTESEVLDKLSEMLADSFEGFNPHFDRTRFLDACGVNTSPVSWEEGEAHFRATCVEALTLGRVIHNSGIKATIERGARGEHTVGSCGLSIAYLRRFKELDGWAGSVWSDRRSAPDARNSLLG